MIHARFMFHKITKNKDVSGESIHIARIVVLSLVAFSMKNFMLRVAFHLLFP